MANIKNFIWSEHARLERMERMTAILMTVGFGEIQYSKQSFENRVKHFTSTGCILVTCDNIIITAYVATRSQMLDFFDGQVPSTVRKIVKESNKKIEWYLTHF